MELLATVGWLKRMEFDRIYEEKRFNSDGLTVYYFEGQTKIHQAHLLAVIEEVDVTQPYFTGKVVPTYSWDIEDLEGDVTAELKEKICASLGVVPQSGVEYTQQQWAVILGAAVLECGYIYPVYMGNAVFLIKDCDEEFPDATKAYRYKLIKN